MGLVDYSSDSSSDSLSPSNAKRRKTSHHNNNNNNNNNGNNKPPPPPLPAAFHDLYASTVRVSTVDDPSLHQGRKRVNPHKVGNWPSHVYIDIRPTDTQRGLLDDLLSRIANGLKQAAAATAAGAAPTPPASKHQHNTLDNIDNAGPSTLSTEDNSSSSSSSFSSYSASFPIHSFLSSDLGAPQPLHISLSRPLSLETAQKDAFLEQARDIVACSGIGAFALRILGVYWHRTRESARSFLVLKVASTSSSNSSTAACPSETGKKDAVPVGEEERAGGDGGESSEGSDSAKQPAPAPTTTTNPELQALLTRLNELVASFGQPMLYATTTTAMTPAATATATATGTATKKARDAFHISIAWSPAEPTDQIRKITGDVARAFFWPPSPSSSPLSSCISTSSARAADAVAETPARDMLHFPVDAVKVKIGNVITSIALPSSVGRRV